MLRHAALVQLIRFTNLFVGYGNRYGTGTWLLEKLSWQTTLVNPLQSRGANFVSGYLCCTVKYFTSEVTVTNRAASADVNGCTRELIPLKSPLVYEVFNPMPV